MLEIFLFGLIGGFVGSSFANSRRNKDPLDIVIENGLVWVEQNPHLAVTVTVILAYAGVMLTIAH